MVAVNHPVCLWPRNPIIERAKQEYIYVCLNEKPLLRIGTACEQHNNECCKEEAKKYDQTNQFNKGRGKKRKTCKPKRELDE